MAPRVNGGDTLARKKKTKWPPWWEWELELSPHLLKRMVDRSFTEVDLRRMLQHASGYRQDVVEGRWRIVTRRAKRAWEVIVEPENQAKLLVIITAYPVEEQKP